MLLVEIVGCQRPVGPRPPSADKNREPVVALVAASTKDAVQEIATSFAEHTQAKVIINADDSSKLATQISLEAPGDLFLSANEKWATFLTEKGFAQETRILLGNALVLVVPKGNPAGIKQPKDLPGKEVQRIGVAGPTVPAGIYARQALKNLNLWAVLQESKKIVSGENVRIALTYVERGEADAGIVYATDAKISDKVEVVYRFDPATHDPIRYPLVLLKEGHKNPAARAFFEYLQSAPAQDTFKKHGFTFLGGT
jgi:molybdate transport system substrate-binding protein